MYVRENPDRKKITNKKKQKKRKKQNKTKDESDENNKTKGTKKCLINGKIKFDDLNLVWKQLNWIVSMKIIKNSQKQQTNIKITAKS